MKAGKNYEIGDIQREEFHASGVFYCTDNIIHFLANEKSYYDQFDDNGKKLYRYDFTNEPAVLESDPQNPQDKNAIIVKVSGHKVGNVPKEISLHVKDILNPDKNILKSCTVIISGGEFKIGLGDGNAAIEDSNIEVSVYLEYIPLKEKKKAGNPIIGFLFLAFIAFIVITVYKKSNNSQSVKSNTPVSSQNNYYSVSSPNKPSAEAMDSFIAISKIILNKNYSDHYGISRDDEAVTINIWGDGVAVGATFATIGEESNLAAWKDMKNSISEFAKTTYDSLNQFDRNAHLRINVLNDINQDNVLLSFFDGVLIFDSVEVETLSDLIDDASANKQ